MTRLPWKRGIINDESLPPRFRSQERDEASLLAIAGQGPQQLTKIKGKSPKIGDVATSNLPG